MTLRDRSRVFPLLRQMTLIYLLAVGGSTTLFAQRGDAQDPNSTPPEKVQPRQSENTPKPAITNLPEIPRVFAQKSPEGPQDLEELETWVRKLVDEVSPYTVGVRIGSSQGSGVIISSDGYVLTAAHVIGQSGRPVTVILKDGREIKATTLGVLKSNDAGLIKINSGKDWAYAHIAPANSTVVGDWCLALGHPNGYVKGREPVLRLGRIVSLKNVIHTDCTLVGGDSGGPLFDMYGRVIGIHSRIGKQSSQNYHVPIEEFLEHWDELAQE